ncbi:ARM repeat-containing protein [Punctularia strigosozonata HHB-11173 SS5]|uniref:ARM repeat-containing protein n=1 Tax=Punctularia strigosozonata (strain HHB-11173) TaxID=741275 RepID=UPI00044163D2|nr:ARM repeat-containing protein [Punctularia strigosozonata HHB-11173 SS5]EIN09802.1 ARM repeat-containing protein [Punctularia strigosozonata HHB-11173 SS5]
MLILDGVSSHALLLDSFIVLHATLVASLYRLVGIDFAALFVQHLMSSYEIRYRSFENTSGIDQASNETVSKECSNLITLLSELYNFQVVSCVLVYDVIRQLLDGDLSELNVELLLKLARNSGLQLRQDDPLALKDIIEIVQKKVVGQPENMTSRMRFMLETLINLKNNRVKKGANPAGDAVDRMKRFLSGLSKTRQLRPHEPLRVSLADLQSASSKGKWWLVGAAWTGDPLLERRDQLESQTAIGRVVVTAEDPLLKLARKQGMNTDIRRNIFVVLMSSEDYVDACNRLAQLNLTEVQQREVVRVLLHCCGNEKSYNPYYALVCQQLCQRSHSYKITLQFCLWDFIRDMGEVGVGGAAVVKYAQDSEGFDLKKISDTRIQNVAKAYGWWIAKDSVTLAILKPVDFTILKERTRGFLTELLSSVLIDTQSSNPRYALDGIPTTRNRGAIEEVFIKATKIQALAMGLVYFLTNAVCDKVDGDAGFFKWAVGVAKDTLQTGLEIVPIL